MTFTFAQGGKGKGRGSGGTQGRNINGHYTQYDDGRIVLTPSSVGDYSDYELSECGKITVYKGDVVVVNDKSWPGIMYDGELNEDQTWLDPYEEE
jgi:hypothetical protein